MAEVILSPRAIRDIEGIRAFIALRDSERYADRMVVRIYSAFDMIAQFPFGGRMVPEMGIATMREVIEGNYRIVYRTFGRERVEVITVYHSARRFPYGRMAPGRK